jgi:aspartate/methionine/tyrosine aminotransferase
MTRRRLAEIPGFSIDRVAAAAGDDTEVLRLENLDTDLAPPAVAVEATRAALDRDDANSWLPFTGRRDLRAAIAAVTRRRTGIGPDADREIVVTNGDGDAMLDAIFVATDPGDEVLLTDPTYAGMLNRVRLAGAVPRLIPLRVADGAWRLDPIDLRVAVTDRTRAIFLLNPAFPTGHRLADDEWSAVADLVLERDLWLVYWSGYEGVVFDGRPIASPLAIEGLRDRTIVVGSVSFEQRMIGWRVGWLIVPPKLADDAAKVHIYNGLVASGHAQAGAAAALSMPGSAADADLAAAVGEWQRRRDAVLDELTGLPAVRPAGAWSLLLDCEPLGVTPAALSAALLAEKVAATPMTGWGGDVAGRHLRFVFSNEPVDRLAGLGDRVRRALAAAAGA